MNMIFNKEALLVVALLVIVGICLFRYKIAAKKDVQDELIVVLTYFKTWNEHITTKQGMLDFYNSLNELFKTVWMVDFKVQLTKQEFEQMSIEAIKQLNEQALDDVINQLKLKPK